MKKTILITGCSSGFGLETAKYFLERNWQVIATMRTPDKSLFPASESLRILPLDVTSSESIKNLVQEAGPIDALVNNAGLGGLNAVEAMPKETIHKIFATNTLGTIEMTQAFIPQFRERKAGTIVNITSSVTLKPLHFLAVYTASKAAVNAFSKVLALELAPFNVNVKIVLPGQAPSTKFSQNAGAGKLVFPEAYKSAIEDVFAGWRASTDEKTTSQDVAEGVWRAVTDASSPMRLPAGADAKALMR